ncbi:MAG: winged helix-turn-helix transcriptional regulator [Candidatus Pacebacteria bacterium]|nr:winged helix-turn-helix transcriptional regulator [Candidatus Paceibacterota bacterium]
MIDKKLQAIGLKEDETKTFIYLVENPGQTAGVIAKKTGLSRPSLYGYLKNLQEKGLIIESQKDGIKTFSATSQDKISIVFDEHIKELENAKKAVTEAFTEIQKGNKPIATPRLQLFEGKKEMQHITKKLLLYKNINAKSYWPIKLMLEVLGEDFFKEFNKERVKRGIHIDAIWPENQVVDMGQYPFMGAGGDFLREIRIAPKEIDFRMGYWIYENKVSFISSSKDNFGFIIESQEFVDMLTSQFDVMWKLSKTIEVTDDESKEWFEKMYK